MSPHNYIDGFFDLFSGNSSCSVIKNAEKIAFSCNKKKHLLKIDGNEAKNIEQGKSNVNFAAT